MSPMNIVNTCFNGLRNIGSRELETMLTPVFVPTVRILVYTYTQVSVFRTIVVTSLGVMIFGHCEFVS